MAHSVAAEQAMKARKKTTTHNGYGSNKVSDRNNKKRNKTSQNNKRGKRVRVLRVEQYGKQI